MKRVYKHLSEPEKYPAFTQRSAKAVTRSALMNTIQFTSLRGFPVTDESIQEVEAPADMGAQPLPKSKSLLKEIRETIDMYVDHFKLGKVLWPVYPTLFAANFNDMVDVCKEKGLYLYDFWGYVPGSKPEQGIWGEYTIPEEADAYMKAQLGDHFLGYDNGEQDGRYVHALANRTAPLSLCRNDQYENFQAYFEKLNDAMRNHTVTLASLTFLHYFAKEGNTIMLGAETAQALPGSNMWFAFIRGAAKQYGLLYYGNASVWNRWGYKDYNWDETNTDMGYEAGRMAGTSLSLLRRLIYNQYMYNCDILGFEGSWFTTTQAKPGDKTDDRHYIVGDKKYNLTPVGILQQKAAAFVERQGKPGVLHTPLAIVADFHSGWVPPRHLYSQDIYKVWGNLPYNTGDYQLDSLFSLLFPHYERAGFFRNESGFLTATPYGEIADVLLSDVQTPVLNRYAAAIITNDTTLDYELFSKLKAFAAQGGKLLVFEDLVDSGLHTAELDKDYIDFFGLNTLSGEPTRHMQWGKGEITVIQEASGLIATGEATYSNDPNEDIPHPYTFTETALTALDAFLKPLSILKPNNPQLQYCLDIKDAEHYTLFVSNNTSSYETFDILALEGSIMKAEPILIADGIPEIPEFLPQGMKDTHTPTMGQGTYTIGAGDCLLFAIETQGIQLEELPEQYPQSRREGRFLALHHSNGSVKKFLLDHPTFSHHFSGIQLPATYFTSISEEAAAREAHYLKLQNIQLAVDFTPLLNHFPDLSIIGNFPHRDAEAENTVRRTLRLAAQYGCAYALFSATRNAENEWTQEMAKEGTLRNWKAFTHIAAEYGIPCHLQNRLLDIPAQEQYQWAEQAGMRKAWNTAFAMCEKLDTAAPQDASLLVLASAAADPFGQLYKAQLPCYASQASQALRSIYVQARNQGITVVLAADFETWDDVMMELAFLEE